MILEKQQIDQWIKINDAIRAQTKSLRAYVDLRAFLLANTSFAGTYVSLLDKILLRQWEGENLKEKLDSGVVASLSMMPFDYPKNGLYSMPAMKKVFIKYVNADKTKDKDFLCLIIGSYAQPLVCKIPAQIQCSGTVYEFANEYYTVPEALYNEQSFLEQKKRADRNDYNVVSTDLEFDYTENEYGIRYANSFKIFEGKNEINEMLMKHKNKIIDLQTIQNSGAEPPQPMAFVSRVNTKHYMYGAHDGVVYTMYYQTTPLGFFKVTSNNPTQNRLLTTFEFYIETNTAHPCIHYISNREISQENFSEFLTIERNNLREFREEKIIEKNKDNCSNQKFFFPQNPSRVPTIDAHESDNRSSHYQMPPIAITPQISMVSMMQTKVKNFHTNLPKNDKRTYNGTTEVITSLPK